MAFFTDDAQDRTALIEMHCAKGAWKTRAKQEVIHFLKNKYPYIMQRYQVNAFWTDKVSGRVLVEDQFAFEQLIANCKPFSTAEAAEAYIRKAGHTWIHEATNRWLRHKRMVAEAQGDKQKIFLIDQLRDGLDKLYVKSLETLCGQIIKIKDKLEQCLPVPQNKSYISSVKNLQEILTFCEENQTIK